MREKKLGDRLKQAREKAQLTQVEAAKKLEITNGAISGYERNYRDPDTETLSRLAELYGVTPNWLLGVEETKESTAVLPESQFDQVISDMEKLYGVNLRDDPVVLAAIRQMAETLARAKANQ